MQANIRVFAPATGGWDEIANFPCVDPILPLRGDAYRGPGLKKYTVTQIEHSYNLRPLDQGGVIDHILIYVE